MARAVSLLGLLLVWMAAAAQENPLPEQQYVADIELQTVEELHQLLQRAEQLLIGGRVAADAGPPVTFILHGPVVRNLLRRNYLQSKDTVDLAASLSALGVVDIKACLTWMGGNRVDEAELQPFVGTVRFGPGEVRRLIEERNYIYF